MALTTKLIWGHTARPWGYEVRVDFEDATGLHHEFVNFPSKPTDTELSDRIASCRSELEQRLSINSEPIVDPVEELRTQITTLSKQVDDLTAEKTALIEEKAVLADQLLIASLVSEVKL